MSKSNLGNPIKEGCFLLGLALLEMSESAMLVAWSIRNGRFEEAADALQEASRQTSQALAADFITRSDAEQMKEYITQCAEALKDGETEKASQKMADLSVKSVIVTFDKVVQCECRKASQDVKRNTNS